MTAPFRAAVDGGSRGNPGIAAWAVVLLGPDDAPVEGHGGFLGHATNNVAEYHGLVEALKLASERNASSVEILADSELVVRQVQGRYKVRHPDLIALHADAMRRIATLASFRIVHVPREKNRDADRLVNRVLDRASEAPPGQSLRLVELVGVDSAGDR
jgi:probable phosphoglycerate mutase